MKHLYLHIPFCLKKCAYCDFCSFTDLDLIPSYIDVLLNEIESYRADYCHSEVETIYFGGGTPSILEPFQVEKILEKIKKIFIIKDSAEITIEANPETISREKIEAYRSLGINRISLGVQSFRDSELKYLGRIHDVSKVREVIVDISSIFKNWSLDLIYNLPKQTKKNVEESILKAISYEPRHISCYELTFEEGTNLYRDKDQVRDSREFYSLPKDILEANGYVQYEISNYAKLGFECKHNLAYWSDRSYLGLGLSAHSYDKGLRKRWSNVVNMSSYLNATFERIEEVAKEIDNLIMGLRKNKGIEFDSISPEFKQRIVKIPSELIEIDGKYVKLTQKGMLFSNQVFLRLI